MTCPVEASIMHAQEQLKAGNEAGALEFIEVAARALKTKMDHPRPQKEENIQTIKKNPAPWKFIFAACVAAGFCVFWFLSN